MRLVFNLFSYVIPSIGVALPLWATNRWDMPVLPALAVVSLAWAYCLFLVLKTISAGITDQKKEDVALGQGVIESINDHTRDSITLDIYVGNDRRKFDALKGVEGKLARGSNVIFAYMRYSQQQPPNVPADSNQSKVHHQQMMEMGACPDCGQLPQFPSAFSCANCGTTTRARTTHQWIVRIVEIDSSTPGRITLRNGQDRLGSTVNGAGRLFNKEDLYNQASMATLIPGAWGALPTAVLAGPVWGWGGWVFGLFFVLAAIWLILFFVVNNVEGNYESIAKIGLDMGYVQKVEEWKTYFGDGPSAYFVNQSIKIADSSPPNGVNQRTHTSFNKTLPIHAGDLALLSTVNNGRISNFRIEPTHEARQAQLLSQHQVAEDACALVRKIGIDASVPQDPFTVETWIAWVQIAEGPIRWVGQSQERGQAYLLYVPDSRITPKFSGVEILSQPLKQEAQMLEESLRLVAGTDLSSWQEEARWVPSKSELGTNKGLSLSIAEQLTNYKTLRENTNRLIIKSNPDLGCWILMRVPITDIRDEPITETFWDFCQEVAEALLAIPLPAEEE